jgi:hypothetical protein
MAVLFFTGAPQTTGVYGADDIQVILNPHTLHSFTSFYLVLPCVSPSRVNDWVNSKIKFVKSIPNRTKLSFLILSVLLDGCITCSLGLKKKNRLRFFEKWVLRNKFGPKTV